MRFTAALIMTAALASAEYADLNGTRVYYEAAGSGTTNVVFIHGWTCDSSFWRFQKPEFAKHFRVVAVDLPGHGKSDKPETTYDLKLFARGVLAVMDAAKMNRAVLAGHSMGSGVIRQIAADAPGRIAAIVTVDGSVLRNPPEATVTKVKSWAATMRGTGGMEVRRNFIESMFASTTPPDVRKQILDGMLAAPEHVAASAMENAIASPIWNSTDQVTIPTLAINQKRGDGRARTVHNEVFSKLEYIEMEGVSHFLHMEKPDEFNRIVMDFIRKTAAR